MVRMAWTLALLVVVGLGLWSPRAEACGDGPCPCDPESYTKPAEGKGKAKAKANEAKAGKTQDGAKAKPQAEEKPTTPPAQGALECPGGSEVLAGKCDCSSAADCTCKKGDCKCEKCAGKKSSQRQPLPG